MATTQTVLRGKDTATQADLNASLELSNMQWKLAIGDGRGHVSRHAVAAGDTAALAVHREGGCALADRAAGTGAQLL